MKAPEQPTGLLERQLHLGQRLERGVGLDVLVGVEDDFALAHLENDRNDLRLEAPFGDRARGALLRFERESVLFLARSIPLGRQIFRGDPHVTNAEGIGEHRDHHVDGLGIAHPRARAQRRQQIAAARHHLDAAADAVVGIAEHDVLRRADNRLQPRRAQAADLHGDRIHRQTGLDRRDARNVGIAGVGRNAVADRHVIDELGIDTRTGDRFLHDDPGQLRGLDAGQRTTESADR